MRLILFTIFLFEVFKSSGQTSSINDSLSDRPTWICLSNLKYPKEAEEKKITGTVILTFDIDSTCHFINIKTVKGIGFGCDEEAIRLLNESQKKCIGIRPKSCDPKYGLKIPITFKYQED